MIVQLILAAGSRAGTTANIHPGYYLIGRHRECQIRPKSRSVSRHHCIVHHSEDGCLVFDLDSTSGTRVNNERIEPRQWVLVRSGDELRCGKVAFSVLVHEVDQETPQPVGAAAAEQGSMVRGSAWQESDIASFLESEDEADRQQRYDSIRDRAAHTADKNDLHRFEDTPLESDEVTSAGDGGAVSDDDDRNLPRPDRHPSTKRREPGRLPDHIKKRLSKNTTTGARFDPDRLKLVAVLIFAVLVLSFAAYSFYQFQGGPQPRVIEGID